MTTVPKPPWIDIAVSTRSTSSVPDPDYPGTLHPGQLVVGYGLGPRGEPQVIMHLSDDSRRYEYTNVEVTSALARKLARQLTECADLADRDAGEPASPW
jgi:hypothetical protein